MKRRLSYSLCLCTTFIMMLSSMTFGQAELAKQAGREQSTPEFKNMMKQSETQLLEIEKRFISLVGRINQAKIIDDNSLENSELDNLMQKYTKGVKAGVNKALDDATEAAKFKGKSGNVANLKQFEEAAPDRERRLNMLEVLGSY